MPAAIAVSTALDLLLRYGPQAVDLALKLRSAVAAGKGDTELTEADWAEMKRLSDQTSADIYARLGIKPPQA